MMRSMTKPSTATPTAICIHGAGGGGWEWAIWQRVFAARGWNVLAPDLQAVSSGIAQTQLADYHAQVLDWCAAVRAPRVLIGASLGGLLALLSAAAAQPMALVLINPLPAAAVSLRPPRRDYADIVRWGSERSLAGTRHAMPDADAAACLFAFRRWRDESGAVMRTAQYVACDSPQCSTLLIASERDGDVPLAVSRALAAQLSAQLQMIAAASHVGPLLGRGAPQAAAAALAWLAPIVKV